ncbi:MAG TPA: aa3-type cytochrome c oxidase subunit IV [Rhodoblastus sp.]|nr:aa3-type cytochrome c oxidase subunit IV [Rhodoblastus sp.]
MAATQLSPDGALGSSDMDYPAHLATYRLFTSLVKWGAGTIIVILLLLAFFTL